MFNLLNIANNDTTFDGEGVSINIDNTKDTTFSFNNLLSLGDKSQSNKADISIFDNFLNSDNISEIDLKHLSQIIDKNPIVSLNMKAKLIFKLDKLKIKFIDNGLIDDIKNKLNSIPKIVHNKHSPQTLSSEFKERMLFTSSNKDDIKQKIVHNNSKEFPKNNNIIINSIQDIEKASDEYGLNISKIKIETYEHKNPQTYKNPQLQTNIDAPEIFNTSDVILLKKIKNKSVDSPNNEIKDIFTSFNKKNIVIEKNEVKIIPTSEKTYPIKEVEKINRLAFFHKTKIEDFKDSKPFKNIQSLNNTSFKNDEKSPKVILDNNIIKNSNISNIKQISSNDVNPIIDDVITNKQKHEPLISKTNIKKIINSDKIYNPKISNESLKIIKDDKEYSLKDVLSSVSKKDILSDKNKTNIASIMPTEVIDKKIKPSVKIQIVGEESKQVLAQEETIKTQIIKNKIEKVLIKEKTPVVKKVDEKVKTVLTQEKVPVARKVDEKVEKVLVKEAKETTTSFYKNKPIETISENNDNKITLKDIFDLKDKIITQEKHILDDKNTKQAKYIITSQEVASSIKEKPQLIKSIFPITSNTKSTNLINVKLDNKVQKTKLLNSLMDNAINRMAITNEAQDDKKIKTLIQELSNMSQEPLKDKKEVENKSIKIQIEPLVLNEEDLNKNSEYNQNSEYKTEQKSTIIDVSKFMETNQSKELTQIMQRQIINGVYENLRYKLSNFVAPLMKFALELKPANLGKIDIDIMVRGNSLQVNIKSNKKVSSLLESEVSELKSEFSVLGYSKITIDFDGSEDSGFSNNKPKDNNNLNIKKDSKWL